MNAPSGVGPVTIGTGKVSLWARAASLPCPSAASPTPHGIQSLAGPGGAIVGLVTPTARSCSLKRCPSRTAAKALPHAAGTRRLTGSSATTIAGLLSMRLHSAQLSWASSCSGLQAWGGWRIMRNATDEHCARPCLGSRDPERELWVNAGLPGSEALAV